MGLQCNTQPTDSSAVLKSWLGEMPLGELCWLGELDASLSQLQMLLQVNPPIWVCGTETGVRVSVDLAVIPVTLSSYNFQVPHHILVCHCHGAANGR